MVKAVKARQALSRCVVACTRKSELISIKPPRVNRDSYLYSTQLFDLNQDGEPHNYRRPDTHQYTFYRALSTISYNSLPPQFVGSWMAKESYLCCAAKKNPLDSEVKFSGAFAAAQPVKLTSPILWNEPSPPRTVAHVVYDQNRIYFGFVPSWLCLDWIAPTNPRISCTT